MVPIHKILIISCILFLFFELTAAVFVSQNTIVFSDNFDKNIIDTSLWTKDILGNGNDVQVTNHEAIFSTQGLSFDASPDRIHTFLKSKPILISNWSTITISGKWKAPDSYPEIWVHLFDYSDPNKFVGISNAPWGPVLRWEAGKQGIYTRDGSNWLTETRHAMMVYEPWPAPRQYINFAIKITKNGFEYYENGVLKKTIDASTYPEANVLSGSNQFVLKIGGWGNSVSHLYFDDIKVEGNSDNPGSISTQNTLNSPDSIPAATTILATPRIQDTPSDVSSSENGSFNAPLPIIIILLILFLAGGGYGVYRMKKKPSGDQPSKENKAIALHPSPTGSTTKPELAITLAETRLIIDKWHKVELGINNNGDAHASDIHLSFSNDFETRWVTVSSVKAKEFAALSIGIKPKTEGNIPIEITASYKDGRNKDYQQVFKFWINVAGKTGIDSGGTPPLSPVSAFTPKPLTPKQLPPDLSDHYTESEFIGKGGFARVFKAKRKDGKYVAVKIPISMDAVTGKSFIAEMQNWTKLSHPNIVRLYDFNIMPLPYFEEELCDNALADQSKPIESEEAAWILFNICEGLKFAHNRKIIHRDLKPQNILLKNGVPKISDWGLSRIISESTTTSATSFTPYYAAPEQINNRVKDERTDIWQLGVILYELVTGELPFKGNSMIEIGMDIATKDPKRPGEIKPEAKVIDAVVMKCLQKDPTKRYQSVLELQKDLAMYLRKNYAELLKTSVSVQDFARSASYCGDLIMINLLTGDIPTAYKYLLDFVHYSKGDVKAEAQELSEQIKMRMEEGVTEIPDELIQKAEIIVHQVSVGFRKRG